MGMRYFDLLLVGVPDLLEGRELPGVAGPESDLLPGQAGAPVVKRQLQHQPQVEHALRVCRGTGRRWKGCCNP